MPDYRAGPPDRPRRLRQCGNGRRNSWAAIPRPGTRSQRSGAGEWCNVRDVEGLSASVVLIAILLGILLVVVFDIFCLLRLGTSDAAHFVPRFVWAVLIVGASPIGGLVYLLAQRLRKRSPEPVTMRPRPLLGSKAWYGPARAEHRHSPASPEGHAVAVVAIAGAVYLAQAGQVLAASAIAVALLVIVFLKCTSPGDD